MKMFFQGYEAARRRLRGEWRAGRGKGKLVQDWRKERYRPIDTPFYSAFPDYDDDDPAESTVSPNWFLSVNHYVTFSLI